jgi:transposase-like protein
LAVGDFGDERGATHGGDRGLGKASAVGAEEGASAKKAGKRGRQKDALGTTSVERVVAHGCPHRAGREVVGWGRSHGLFRFRSKSCGSTFNALTKTPTAHLRKEEKWLDHARAMIEGKSLAKTAQLCGVHPTTAFRWRHRFLPRAGCQQAAKLERDRRSGRDLRPRILQRPVVRSAPRATQTRRQSHASGPLSGQYSRSRRPRPEGRALRRDPASGRGASIGAALAGLVTEDNHLIGDGGRPIAAFARRAGIPFHAVPSPGKPTPEAPHLHINNVNAYHGRLKQWLNRFNGVATKNLPNYLGSRRALEGWGGQLAPHLDQSRYRKRTIPIANALRAGNSVPKSKTIAMSLLRRSNGARAGLGLDRERRDAVGAFCIAL